MFETSSRISAESQVWPWFYKQQLFHFDILSGVGCDISSTGICLFYAKSSCKIGHLVSHAWGAVSEIAVKTRSLGLKAPCPDQMTCHILPRFAQVVPVRSAVPVSFNSVSRHA